MTEQQPTSAPPEFIRLLEQAIRNFGLTKAQVAFKADISPVYLFPAVTLGVRRVLKNCQRLFDAETSIVPHVPAARLILSRLKQRSPHETVADVD